MHSPRYLFRMLLLLCVVVIGVSPLAAQTTIDTNSSYTADFHGKRETHSWVVNLKDDFNDFRLELQSPVGDLIVFLVEPGQTRGTKLQPASRTCHGAASVGVRGKIIEATLPKDKKLGPGRHTIKVSPADPRQNVNKYSIKVTEPVFSPPAVKDDATRGDKPSASGSPSQGELLGALNDLRDEMKGTREAMKAIEKRLDTLESAESRR